MEKHSEGKKKKSKPFIPIGKVWSKVAIIQLAC